MGGTVGDLTARGGRAGWNGNVVVVSCWLAFLFWRRMRRAQKHAVTARIAAAVNPKTAGTTEKKGKIN
jgi:hypothetical protein